MSQLPLAELLAGLLALAGARGGAQGPELSFTAEPREAEIGQPIAVELELVHAAGARLSLDPEHLVPDGSWIVLEPPRVVRTPVAEEQAEPAPATPLGPRVRTRASWVVASLEPGARALPPPRAELSGQPPGAPTLESAPLEIPALVLGVRPALQADEDAPRPPRGFREPRELGGAALSPGAALLAAGLALAILVLLAAAAALLAHRRRRAPAATPAPSPRERLAALRGAREPAATRAAFFELTGLVRAALDARLRRDLSGLTDEEWLAETPPSLLAGTALQGEGRERLVRLSRRAEAVKYAFEVPTVFALEEALGEAGAVLDAIDAIGAPGERGATAPATGAGPRGEAA